MTVDTVLKSSFLINMELSDLGLFILVMGILPILVYTRESLFSIFPPRRDVSDIKRIVLFLWLFITFFFAHDIFTKNVPKYRYTDSKTFQSESDIYLEFNKNLKKTELLE